MEGLLKMCKIIFHTFSRKFISTWYFCLTSFTTIQCSTFGHKQFSSSSMYGSINTTSAWKVKSKTFFSWNWLNKTKNVVKIENHLPSNDSLAAFVIASSSNFVMSPRNKETFSAKFEFFTKSGLSVSNAFRSFSETVT